MSATILIVDDEESILKTLGGVLEDEGYKTLLAGDGVEALAIAQRETPDLVMLDIWMPRMEGLETLQRIKAMYPDLVVIMMSGHGTIETAVKSTRMGAYDFIEKPLSLEKVILTVNNALSMHRLRQENASLRGLVLQDYQMVGASQATLRLKEQVLLVAPTAASVLLAGENGTGKELMAKVIHMHSGRKDKPLVEINCAAIPEELLDYELFGWEKGAFPGAIAHKRGRFDLADGGTLFLEEIGDMPLKTQAKVLRVMEEGKFVRSGGTRTVSVDVRIIAATSRNLEEEVRSSRFKEDLFYRLNVVHFVIPPLRARIEDVGILAEHFLQLFCSREGHGSYAMAPEALDAMMCYDWPGNVRELKNIIERLVIMTPGTLITDAHLPDYITSGARESFHPPDQTRDMNSLRLARERFEREFIIRKLEENSWDIGATADLIKLERSNLQRKIKTYGISLKN